MADQSDVETALVRMVSSALYPAGPVAASAVGVVCRVFRGWPSSAALEADLTAGVINVSVFPLAGQQRNTTRFPDVWDVVPGVPTLRVTASGDCVAFDGTASAGQVVGLLVDGKTYRYVTAVGDTPRLVANQVLELVGGTRLALLLNETIRFPGVSQLVARVVVPGSAMREVRRQQESFRISFWCPAPGVRDRVVAAVDLNLASQAFIALPDESSARLRFVRSETVDRVSDATLYRRDLIYEVEFATLMHDIHPAMLFGDLRLNDAPDCFA